jgi:hypothetical protein
MPKQPLTVGDRVRYSSEFCRRIGAISGFTPQARGIIKRLWGKPAENADILWDFMPVLTDPTPLGGAHTSNLERCR